MSGKSYQTKSFDKSYTYSQEQKNNPYKYPTKREDKTYSLQQKYMYDDPYTQRQKFNHDNPRYDDKSYHQQQKNAKTTKQAQPRNIYKYKIERDESGNCSYVLEEPVHNPLNLINNSEIVCIYPNNGTKYYKNVNIYNYKKKLKI
jgi:hypothetical protein